MLRRALVGGSIKISGRLLKLIEHEDHRAEQKNEELHWHFHDRVEEKAEAARLDRVARQVALNLGLIRPEVGESEEKSSDDAGPKSIALVRIDREIDRLQFSQFSCNRERMSEGNLGRQSVNDDQKRDDHANQDDHHLVALRQADDLGAAGHGVNNDQPAGQPDGQIQSPSEQSRQDNGRRVDGDPGGEAALHEEQEGAEQLRFAIKPLTEILVGGVDF